MKKSTIIIILGSLIIGVILGLIISPKGNKTAEKQEQTDSTKVDYWTCSMHPQIHADEPGNCPICGMELIPATNSTKAVKDKSETMLSEDAVKLANIQTSVVKFADGKKEILLQGEVYPDETRIYTQALHFEGRVEKIYVNYVGQYVKSGQKIALVYSPDLVTAQQEFLQAVKYKSSNPLLYDAAKNKLKFWKLSDRQIANLEKNGTITEKFAVLAEHSGYVTELNVNEGDYLKEGAEMFKIADLSKVWVVFDAYEKDLPFLKIGDEVNFKVNSLPAKEFKTKIVFISPVINEKKRTYDVRTIVNNTGTLLKTGMFTQGIIEASLGINKKMLIVPKSSVLWTGKRSVVYVKLPDRNPPTYQLRVVTLGADLGSYYEIISGLNEGDEIVTNGAFTIDAAAELAGNYSMLNLPENKTFEVKKIKNVSQDFAKDVNTMIDVYETMTNFLIAASPEQVALYAQKLNNIAKKINTSSLNNEDRKLWDKNLKIIIQQSDNMVKMNNIDMQRKHYKELSLAMIEIVKSFNNPDKKLYVQYCPMYDNNNGAFWLSDKKEIKNPYFGDQMLTCGSTKDSIM